MLASSSSTHLEIMPRPLLGILRESGRSECALVLRLPIIAVIVKGRDDLLLQTISASFPIV
jgi:hypothetical protein